jgi:hypothetical protein
VLYAAAAFSLVLVGLGLIGGTVVALADILDTGPTTAIDDQGAYYFVQGSGDDNSKDWRGIDVSRPSLSLSRNSDGGLRGLFFFNLTYARPLTSHDSFHLALPQEATNVFFVAPTQLGARTFTKVDELESAEVNGNTVGYSPDTPEGLRWQAHTRRETNAQVVDFNPRSGPIVHLGTDTEGVVFYGVQFDAPADYIYKDGLALQVVRVIWRPALVGDNKAADPDAVGPRVTGRAVTPDVEMSVCGCVFVARDLINGGLAGLPPVSTSLDTKTWILRPGADTSIEFPLENGFPRILIAIGKWICLPVACSLPLLGIARWVFIRLRHSTSDGLGPSSRRGNRPKRLDRALGGSQDSKRAPLANTIDKIARTGRRVQAVWRRDPHPGAGSAASGRPARAGGRRQAPDQGQAVPGGENRGDPADHPRSGNIGRDDRGRGRRGTAQRPPSAEQGRRRAGPRGRR